MRCICLIALVASAPLAAQEPLKRIVVGSGASQEKPQLIWDAVLAAKPELAVLLGNSVFLDSDNPAVLKAKYAQFGSEPGFTKLRSTCPVVATWDDHDYGAIQGGAEFPSKEASQKLFLEFFQEPKFSPRWKRPGVYDARVFGPPEKRVQVILLDGRTFRSPLKKSGPAIAPNTDAGATLLGDAQWKWLAEELRKPAELRLIGSAIPVIADEPAGEKWANFPAERERLYKLLRDTKAAGVVLLSGNRLTAELSVTDAGLGYPLYELTASGLNMGNQFWHPPEKAAHRIAALAQGDNFGVIAIDWARKSPRVELQIRDVEGDIIAKQKIDIATLKPGTISPSAAQPVVAGPKTAGAISPIDAAAKVGQSVTVELLVAASGKARDNSRVFLNSAARDSKENFTVVLDMKKVSEKLAAAGIKDPAAHYKGKTILVTGVVSTFRDAPQIVVEDVGQIHVVEK
ncbi:MAG: alkaline phosphatase D family protein [Gemmataceae bacterium]